MPEQQHGFAATARLSMSRAEQSFLESRTAREAGTVSWAEMAARGGYADQAHLCRETRAITGHTPTELARRAMDDESYWLYRIRAWHQGQIGL